MAGYYLTRHVVQPGVGLVAEAVAHRKAKKSDKEIVEETIATKVAVPEDGDEKLATLDKTVSIQTLPPYPSDAPPDYRESELPLEKRNSKDKPDGKDRDVQAVAQTFEQMQVSQPSKYVVQKGNVLGPAPIKTLVNSFVAFYPPIRTGAPLQAPVVIPQRRPGDRSRGFLRAYAPLLQEVGISQNTWLDFMTTFEESIKITPAFNVFNMAVGLVHHFAPNPFTVAVTIALSFAEETAKQTYGRIRSNSFFGDINEKYFMPLGLYCLIMTYDPYARAVSEEFDISGQVTKAHGKKTVRAYLKRNLGGVKGKTKGEAQMPEAAELLYPEEEEGKGNRYTRTRKFVDEYFDKRANSRFAADNPSSVLAKEPEFESSMGSFGTRHQHSGRGGPIGASLSYVVEAASVGKYQGRAANPFVMATRAARSKALYLMVVPLPTEEERRQVRECFEVKEMSEDEAAEHEKREEEEDRREEEQTEKKGADL